MYFESTLIKMCDLDDRIEFLSIYTFKTMYQVFMFFVPAGNLRALLHEDFLAPFWCEVNAMSFNKTLGTQTALMRNYRVW